MKTTLDLPDELLIEAKALAARRQTTLRALIEHALIREIHPVSSSATTPSEVFQAGPLGLLSFKKRGVQVTSRHIQQLLEEHD